MHVLNVHKYYKYKNNMYLFAVMMSLNNYKSSFYILLLIILTLWAHFYVVCIA